MNQTITTFESNLLGKKLDLLLRTGQLLIQSLADSNRIDRNMRRAALFMKIPAHKFHMHINYTTLMINISEGGKSVTKLQKCANHGVNMNVLSEISKLTWEAMEKQFSLEEYEKKLEQIAQPKHNYPRWLIVLGIGLACGGFCKLFGCDWPAFFITAFSSSTAIFARQEMHKRHFNLYMNVAISSFIAVALACLATFFGWSQTPHHPIFASVLFLIPGVPLINCVDDMIDGFTIVGVTRAVIASLTIGAITFGMIFALKLFRIDNYDASLSPQSGWLIIGLAAAIASTGFAMLFNVPRHTLWVASLGGAAAVVTRNLMMYQMGINLPMSSLCGALVVGLASLYIIHRVHVPAHVISVPSVIPMIPGVLMYKGMIGILGINASGGLEEVPLLLQTMESGIKAGMTILCISLGVAIPNVIGRRYLSKSKQKLLKQTLSAS